MAKEKLTKEQKAQKKLEKLNAKNAKKEADKLVMDELKMGYDSFEKESKTKEFIKRKKSKKEKESFDFKLAFKEMPIKMIKEVNKINWSTKENLGKKFLWVILFLLVFAIFFYFVNWGLEELFIVAKII